MDGRSLIRRSVFLAFGYLLLIAALACGAATTAVATPVATETPVVTPTPSPSTPTPTPTPTPALFPLTVTGSDGAEVVLERPPERIVATHEYVTYPPEVAGIQKVGDAFNVNFEKIAELNPDLIYIFFDRFVPDLEKLGARVLYVESPSKLGGVGDQMRMWGRIVGRPEAGEELARGFETSVEALAAKAGDGSEETPGVYIDVAPMLWTLGAGSLADEMVALLKAENAFADVDMAKQVSAEEIVSRAPDVVISTYEGGTAQFTSDPAFASLPAVQNGRLCEIDGSLVSAPGPRLVDGIQAIGECVYPDRFP